MCARSNTTNVQPSRDSLGKDNMGKTRGSMGPESLTLMIDF